MEILYKWSCNPMLGALRKQDCIAVVCQWLLQVFSEQFFVKSVTRTNLKSSNDGRQCDAFLLSHQSSVSIFNFNPLMHNFEKCPSILLRSCGAHTARFIKYVWPLFNNMHEKVYWIAGSFSRSNRPKLFCNEAVLKTFRKMYRKTPVMESLFNKVAILQACNFMKKRVQHRCFPVNITKFLWTPVLQKNFSKFTEKHLQCSFFYKVESWGSHHYII